jgi:hypothetical protein
VCNFLSNARASYIIIIYNILLLARARAKRAGGNGSGAGYIVQRTRSILYILCVRHRAGSRRHVIYLPSHMEPAVARFGFYICLLILLYIMCGTYNAAERLYLYTIKTAKNHRCRVQKIIYRNVR